MRETFKAVRVTDRIWWVGAIDWKVTLVDTVKHGFSEELAGGVRLACQVGEQGDLAVVLPEELFHADRYRGLVEDITDLTCDVKRIRIRLLGPATRWPSTARTGKRLFLTPLSLHMYCSSRVLPGPGFALSTGAPGVGPCAWVGRPGAVSGSSCGFRDLHFGFGVW